MVPKEIKVLLFFLVNIKSKVILLIESYLLLNKVLKNLNEYYHLLDLVLVWVYQDQQGQQDLQDQLDLQDRWDLHDCKDYLV